MTRRVLVLLAGVLLAPMWGCGGGGGPDVVDPPPAGPACPAWPESFRLAETGAIINDVVALSSCSLLVGGFFGAANPFEPEGDTTGFVSRLTLDADGVVREDWRHLLDSGGTDVVSRIELLDAGIRYLGWTDGAMDGQIAHGKSDVVIGLLDANGGLQARSRMGDERPNRPLRLFDLSATEHVLIGNDDVYVPTNFVEAWPDPWVAGVGSSGTQYQLQWMQRANTEVGDRYFDVARLADDSLLLARGTDAGPARGLVLERRWPDGTPLWSVQLTQGPFDGVAALHHRSSGKLLVYGSTFQDLGGGMAGGADLFVVEVDPSDGASRLVSQFGSSDTDWATAMVAMDGQLYLVSERYPNGADPWQVRLSRISTDGVLLEERVLSELPSGAAMSATVAGTQLVVAGASGTDAAALRGWLRSVPLATASASLQ